MFRNATVITALLTAVMLLTPFAMADEATDKAFDALKTYDWGQDRNVLKPIDDAVAASHDDEAAQKALQTSLIAVLGGDGSQAAKGFACRKLSLIGSAGAVPALAALLTDEKLSHMGRYALERMPCAEALAALRDAVAKTKGKVKVGVINSLGIRRDAESIAALTELTKSSEKQIAAAAIAALGSIGTQDAAKALAGVEASDELKPALADASLRCAEQLLADGKKLDAMKIYKSLVNKDQPKHVRVAATRGLLAAASSK